MRNTKILLLLMPLFLLLSCGGGGDDSPIPPIDNGGDDPVTMIPNPTATALIFPENNSECNEGTIVNENESDVNFRWNASENTDSYSVKVTNLLTSESFNVVQDGTERVFRLQRGTPYEWSVESRSDRTNNVATSENSRFFNEGPGIENYAPFPAQAINPPRGATLPITTEISLEWNTSDIDDDLKEYEVLIGTSIEAITSLGIFTNTKTNISVSSGTTYYWMVKTFDNGGNSSTSEVFQFKIE